MTPQPTTIPEEQVWQRWDVIPPSLREELASYKNGGIVRQTCEAEHLSEEKADEVSRISSWVLLGFLHPEDVANEIKLSTGVHPDIANKISGALNAKIFAPLHEILEDAYAPAGTHPEEGTRNPVLMEEIRKPTTEETLEKLKPHDGTPFFTETPVSLEELGEKVKGEKVEGNEPAPFPNFTDIPPEPPAPSSNLPTFSPPTSEEGAAPFMIHEEAAAPELPRVEDFSLNIKPEEFGPSMPEMEAPPQANIEIGGTSESLEGEKVKRLEEENKEERVVHYGDLRTPLEPSIPETPFSAMTEPNKIGEKAEGEKVRSEEPEATPIPDLNTPIDLGGLSGTMEPEPPSPKVEPQEDSRGSTLEETAQKKTGFFARLFGKKNPPNPPNDGGGPDPDLPPAPEVPSFSDAPPLPLTIGEKVEPEIPPSPPNNPK